MKKAKLLILVIGVVLVLFGGASTTGIFADQTVKTPKDIPFDEIISQVDMEEMKYAIEAELYRTLEQDVTVENVTLGEPIVSYRFDVYKLAKDDYLAVDFYDLLEKVTFVTVLILFDNQPMYDVQFVERNGQWKQTSQGTSPTLDVAANQDTFKEMKLEGKTAIIIFGMGHGWFTFTRQGDEVLIYPVSDFRGIQGMNSGKARTYRAQEILPILHEAAKELVNVPPMPPRPPMTPQPTPAYGKDNIVTPLPDFITPSPAAYPQP
jgi:hypothetical protein